MTATLDTHTPLPDHGGGPSAVTARAGRRTRRIRRAGLFGLVVLVSALGLASCAVQAPVTGVYSVNINGSIGEITVHQSGTADSAVFTATVSAPFKPSGFTCSLMPGTVVASFTGAGPTFTERYAKFNATTCVKIDDGYTPGAVATLNSDTTLTLGLATSGTSAQSALLTRIGDVAVVPSPVPQGDYAVNVNGSVGALSVHQSGTSPSPTYTVSVTAPFKPSGFSCSLAPGTVMASFTGAGPTFTERYAKFNATTCVKIDDGYTPGAIALLDNDNSLVLGLASAGTSAHAALLTRTGNGSTVANPVAEGTYSVNVNSSIGTITVAKSGTGATAIYTASVSTAFTPSGFSCSLAPGTVVASFTGAGPGFTEQYAKFNASTCVKINDGYTPGAVALLNGDNTLTLGLASAGTSAHASLLSGRT